MEADPLVLPMTWEKINDVWYTYVKGHDPREYFGVDDRPPRYGLARQVAAAHAVLSLAAAGGRS